MNPNEKNIYFGKHKLDRASHLRERTAQLEELKLTHDVKYIPVYNGRHIYMNEHSSFYRRSNPFECEAECFLGMVDNQMWYSCPLNEQQAHKLEQEAGKRFASLRRYALKLNDELAHIALYSRGLDLWQRNRLFCPKCGTKTNSHGQDTGCCAKTITNNSPTLNPPSLFWSPIKINVYWGENTNGQPMLIQP